MQFIKITTILLVIALGALASDAGSGANQCYDINDCLRKSVKRLAFVNARRANEALNNAAAVEVAV